MGGTWFNSLFSLPFKLKKIKVLICSRYVDTDSQRYLANSYATNLHKKVPARVFPPKFIFSVLILRKSFSDWFIKCYYSCDLPICYKFIHFPPLKPCNILNWKRTKYYVSQTWGTTSPSIQQAPRYCYWIRFKRNFLEDMELPSKL